MKLITIILSLLFFALPATADQVPITSVWVTDGDTVKAKDNGKKIKIRLANIDAPERRQPGGKASKWALINFLKGKEITVILRNKDRYKRWIGVLYADGVEVNSHMVRTGHAWVYTRYNTDDSLPALQAIAKNSGLGLWGEANPIAPWKWRKGQR